jgi:hypothetical protein
MAQPDVRMHKTLEFSRADEITILKKQGNFKNVRICNGKLEEILAKKFGVLAVLCRRNNGGQLKPPADPILYNITMEIPRSTSGGDNGRQNGGITTLLEITNINDPNVTVSQTATSTFVNVLNAGTGSSVSLLN